MDKHESFFADWVHQCFGRMYDYDSTPVAYCAYGWLYFTHGDEAKNVMWRIGRYIQTIYDLPDNYPVPGSLLGAMNHPKTNPHHAALYANDVLKLTPAQFREIDLKTREAA